MVAQRCFVFARAIAQHGFRKAPIAAAGNEAASVDKDFQDAAVFRVGELADAGLEGFRVRDFSIDGERKRDGIEVGIAIADGPPELRIREVKCGLRGGSELDGLCGGGVDGYGGFDGDVAKARAEHA